jgi:hypothetical protein
VIGNLHLGALWLTDVDQPWYHCPFDPVPAFEAVRPLFDAANQALKAGELDRADELVEVIAAKGVRLVWGNGEAQPPTRNGGKPSARQGPNDVQTRQRATAAR